MKMLKYISIQVLILCFPLILQGNAITDSSKFDWFPLAAYDSDIGIGGGIKCFYLNPLHKGESFDLILFGSTKGERWVKFAFSYPDLELRQGREYPFAVDFSIDYDLWISNSYYGVGSNSRYEGLMYYSKEPLEIKLNFNRTLTRNLIPGAGLKFRTVNNYNIDSSYYSYYQRKLDAGRVNAFSGYVNLRYDTRNSFINPDSGACVMAEIEYAPAPFSDYDFVKFHLEASWFYKINFLETVFAARFLSEWQSNENLPIQLLLPVGGNRTMRGAPQDRFLDNAMSVVNCELRYPVYKRWGGIIGFDAGRVWNNIGDYSFNDWNSSIIVGLRYYKDLYIIRADMGFGSETTCLYLNIGHMF